MADELLRFVDWSWKPIPRLPLDLFASDDIWRLNLIRCGVEELPEAIGSLLTLNIAQTNIREIPPEASRIPNLLR